MKSEKQLKERLMKINLILSEDLGMYIPKVKQIELQRERWFLEDILELKHTGEEK